MTEQTGATNYYFDELQADFGPNGVGPVLNAALAPVGTGVAAVDSAGLTLALAAMTAGGHLTFQGSYRITAPLTPPAGVTLVAARGTVITQATQMMPVFDLYNVDNVTIGDGFTLVNASGPPASLGSSFRGDSGYAYSAGVWSNGNGITVGNLRIKDFAMGVYLNSSNGTVNADGTQRVGNTVGNLEISGCNHGVLYLEQVGLRLGDIYVHDHVDSSAGVNPNHAIYGTGVTAHPSQDVTVGRCLDVNNTTGCAFQFKYVNGLAMDSLRARNALGLLNVIDSFDVTGTNLTSLADTALGGSLVFQKVTTQSARVNLSDITINSAVDSSNPIVALGCDDAVVSALTVNSLHNGTNVNASDVEIRGLRVTIDGVKMRNTGSSDCRAIFINGSYTSGDATIRGIEVDTYRNLVDIGPAVSGINVIEYAPAMQRRIHFGTSSYISAVSGTPVYAISRAPHTNVYAVHSGAVSPFPLAGLETCTLLNVTDASNFTINNPVIGLYLGLIHDVAIFNNTAGATGTITWGTLYALRSALTAPAAGDTVKVQFMYDGAHWREIARSV